MAIEIIQIGQVFMELGPNEVYNNLRVNLLPSNHTLFHYLMDLS